jgi:hypothetical protein
VCEFILLYKTRVIKSIREIASINKCFGKRITIN